MSGFIFDLDDTLYNERDFVLGGFRAVANYLEENVGVDADVAYAKCVELLDTEGRGRIFNNLCLSFNCVVNTSTLVSVYRKAQMGLELYPDVIRFIEKFEKSEHKLGIITDGLAFVQWSKIEQLKLKDKFDAIIVSDDYGKENWKPSPFPYKLMCEKLGLPPEECVYVGDNAHKDFVSAKEMGMATVHIRRDVGEHKDFIHENDEYNADESISTLDQLPQILRAMSLL